jgi:hypothetical protein
MLIPDPCGPEPGYEFVFACFLEQLVNSHNSRSATVRSYTESINTLFQLWNFPVPGNLSDKENTCSKIIIAHEREEDIAKQCSPITKEMFAAMADKARTSDKGSVASVLFDWFCFIRITGLQVAEYAQSTQTSVDVHKYPSGKTVIKAFIANDWKFHDKKGEVIDAFCPTSMPTKVKATFQIQKNRRNGQLVTIVSKDNNPDICPVRAVQRIVKQAKWLEQSKSEPLAVFLNRHGLKKYLTGNKITEILQSVARLVHPNLSKDKISHFSSHSGRVWALVLLDEAGMPPEFVQFWLRWLGESCRLYLQDTLVIQNKHLNALNKALMRSCNYLGIIAQSHQTMCP